MSKKHLLHIFIIAVLVVSCGRKTFDTTDQLWEYIKDPDNNYLQEKNIRGVDYKLLYKPHDLLVNQALGEERSDSLIKKYKDKYKDHLYFTLSMSKSGHELLSHLARDRNQFGAMVNQLAFGMNEKVHMYTPKKDTLPMTDFIYPRMYGMSGTTSILFVYPKRVEDLKEDYLNFTINDLGFHTGEVKFKVPMEVITDEVGLSLATDDLSR